ncbi:TIP41-like family protein [Actinidia rufa]|uniref:Protein FAR1-RELATED SEQUENCE n=1 Tax=Actinidia rufa TaxID=165716 RepID=A0A7J0EDD3_9ERIC|nr:TIP41-like family protein [Actinidia rufa]
MMSPESVTSAMPLNNEYGEEEDRWSGDNEREQDGKEVTEICEDRVEEPKEGMTFDTSEEAYLFYCRYAQEKGFSSCWKGEGKNKQSGQTAAQSRMNCPAHIRVVNRDGKFNLNRVVLDHNHEQSPGKARYFKSNRVLDEHVKRRLELNDKAGIKMHKTYELLQIEAGGHDKLPYLKKDCRNYLDKQRRLRLVEGDAEAMHRYFMKMKADNSDFFFALDLDDKGFIKKYELESNTWLEGLYSERKRWVPAYLKDVFWAGMSSTQRSEGINAYFDGYIHSKTTLKQFVEQYENALASKVESENLEDVKSWSTYIPCITKGELEKQFQSVYTHAKVKEFQEQFIGKLDCLCSKTKEGDIVSEYEFRGMVCTHQLMVWHQMGVQRVPDKYVLRRWCKNVKRVHTKVWICYDKSSTSIEARRHDNMCNLFNDVADLAEESQDKYDMVMTRVRQLKQELMQVAVVVESNVFSLGDGMSIQEKDSFSLGDGVIPSKRSTNILDPEGRQRKGRPSTKRRISVIEKVIKKKRQTKRKPLSNEQYKEVEEISVGHDIGTQFEKVECILSHPSYTGHSMWPNMMPHNMPLNMAQGGIKFGKDHNEVKLGEENNQVLRK